jgi:hypothetical protein
LFTAWHQRNDRPARHPEPPASVVEYLSGVSRQACGYLIADIRAAIKAR